MTQFLDERITVLFLQLALPYTKYGPTPIFKHLCDGIISLDVTTNFLRPKILIVLRTGVSTVVSVPKTSIHKYRNSLLNKNEVGVSLDRIASQPTANAPFSENGDEHQLSGLVSFPLDVPHHGGAFFFTIHVRQ